MREHSHRVGPGLSFTTLSSMAIVIGIVVGIGIFRLPPIIAANSTGELQFIMFWVAGGVISLMGALCYAELSSSMPDAGGEYYFLRKAFGPATGFFLSWGRMTVIQTGSIALIAFILGDYATLILDLGTHSASIYAALTVVLLTLLNLLGTLHSRWFQNILASIIVVTLVIIAFSGLFLTSGEKITGFTISGKNMQLFSGGAPGLAMIFVLLTYGGWSEAAYLTGELHNVKKSIVRALVSGIAIITGLYVLVNLTYLHVLGFDTLAESSTVGYDLTEIIFGPGGSVIVVIIVIVSALSTANATIITGARTNYAIGRDFRLFRFMGRWNQLSNSPANALIFQGVIALVLVGAGAWSKEAISTMVDYTAPVFWFFIMLITISLFVFRYRNGKPEVSYRVPFYPLPPLLFLAACVYMLYSSLVFTGTGAMIGAAVLVAGGPVWFILRRYQR